MNKITTLLILALICIGGILNAQERTYTQKMDSLMQYGG
ncbi:Uncharacterised protein [Bergeyella zoohelcum]|uniref:Uncharacterized protein n=1 Tax=Bergeyella zoohelcum TaxID=1015 RepID=A0A7Z8YN37_9FLAO|nr:Uncharacterised protein [Bergeyella zoohelcum]